VAPAGVTSEIAEVVARVLAEDLGAGDLTTAAVVPPDARARARIEQRAPGVLSGVDVAREAFRQLDPELRFEALAVEGAWRDGGEVASIEGPAAPILSGERTALNFLGRLSGVATMTARYVRAVEGTGARILDTRKTTPGLRALEKRAVVHGGGVSHRAGLHDAILVKENHALLAGGVGPTARAAAANRGAADWVEVEVESLAELDEVLAAGADRVLLDNMDPGQLRAAVERAAGSGATLEASGGIALEDVRAVAATGVDFVSVGALTHSAPALDLSLLLEPA
jgi:nicotinate-nucleotide pyrophosphorylase (carboxylating)